MTLNTPHVQYNVYVLYTVFLASQDFAITLSPFSFGPDAPILSTSPCKLRCVSCYKTRLKILINLTFSHHTSWKFFILNIDMSDCFHAKKEKLIFSPFSLEKSLSLHNNL